MTPSNFSFSDWEAQNDPKVCDVPVLNQGNLPKPPDRYRPGHLTMGKDVDRGLAIQYALSRKRYQRNVDFFRLEVLPRIADKLNPQAWRELAQQLGDTSLYVRGGFVRYALGDRASWIHPIEEPDKVKQALWMGAKPTT